MSELMIGYEWVFNVVVKKRNGKVFKSHLAICIGTNYVHALWNVHFELKRKHNEIVKVNRVRVEGNAFAIAQGNSVSVKLADYPPDIPEDLNREVEKLPNHC